MIFRENESNGRFAVRAVISSILVIALIVGLIAFGNIMDNRKYNTLPASNSNGNSNSNDSARNNSNNNESRFSNITGNMEEQRVDLLSGQTKYDIKIAAGKCEILPTDSEPYMIIKSNYDVRYSAEAHDDEYDIEFKLFKDPNHLFHLGDGRKLYITIYLPDEMLESLDIDLSAGEVSVSNVASKKMDVDISAGTLDIVNCDMREFDSDITAGELFVQVPLEIDKIKVDITAGDTEISLPKDISGFKFYSDVTAGGVENDSSFNILKNEGFKNTISTHGDERCDIRVSLTAGSLTVSDY